MDTVIAMPADERHQAVSDQLRWFGLTDADRLEALAARFVREAEEAGAPGSAPDRAAAAVTDWFARILGPRLGRPDLAGPLGRAAFLIAGGSQRWADAFLADDPPAELVASLRRVAPIPAPEVLPAAMVAQSLALPSFLPSLRWFGPRVERRSA